MVDANKIANELECRRHQAELVDLAEGVLAEPARVALEAHLRSCSACAAALAALRELPPILQEAGAVPGDEEFWRQQRDDIMARIEQQRARGRTRRLARLWGAASAAAAALVLTVVGYQTLREHELPAGHTGVSLAQLDEESVAELNDLMDLYVPETRLLPVGVASEADGVPRGIAEPKRESTDHELRDFSEDDLEHLNHLLGELG